MSRARSRCFFFYSLVRDWISCLVHLVFSAHLAKLHVLVREEVLLRKIAGLDLVGADKGSVLGWTGEVADALHAAVVLAQWLIILHTHPDPCLELGQS